LSAGPGEILADLSAELTDLDLVIRSMSAPDWDLPTPAPGWQIRHQVQHLAFGNETAAVACTDPGRYESGWQARSADPDAEQRRQDTLARADTQVLAGRWDAAARMLLAAGGRLKPSSRVRWAGREMSASSCLTGRLMEIWAHGQDIVDALDVTRTPTMRLRHIAHLAARTRAHSYAAHGREVPGRPVGLQLTAPDGTTWASGPADAAEVICGPMVDFCLVATRRRHWRDTALRANGAAAAGWLDIAQAYAGPPGPGREAGQFRRGSARPGPDRDGYRQDGETVA
jgi:uncharacterized protein (TIGR03084 family)